MSDRPPVVASDLAWYPCVKAWSLAPEYVDAPFAARVVVDAALGVFMRRGSVPDDADALRNAIGAAGWREYPKAYDAARRAIDALLPLWRAELERSVAFVQRQRDNGVKGGRPPGPGREPRPKPKPNPRVSRGLGLGNPGVRPDETTLTPTDSPKGESPKAPRSARSGGGEPEGFEAFWERFRAAYPKRPGQPWPEGRRAMLAALRRRPDLSLALVLDAAGAYRELMEATGKAGTDKVAHASTWLNNDRWDCDYTMVPRDGEDDGPLF